MGFTGFAAVGIGAAIGAWLRWWLGIVFMPVFSVFPLGTLIANLVGGYLMGLFIGLVTIGSTFSPEIRLFLVTGFLGGLTTFSSFSGEAVTLFTRGEYHWAAAHLLSHVLGSLAMTALGMLTIQVLKTG